MQELLETIEKHWVLFSTLGAGVLYLTKHLITNHQLVQVNKTSLEALKVYCDNKAREDIVVVKDLVIKIDDYHIKAVARESNLRQESQHLVDKARLDIGKEITVLERELRADIKAIAHQLTDNNKLLTQLVAHNENTAYQIDILIKAKDAQLVRTEEFWKNYGALLPELKRLIIKE